MLAAKEALDENSDQKLDEAIRIWDKNASDNEELFRLKIFQSIRKGTLADSLYDANIIGFLLAFDKKESQSLVPYYHAPSYSRVDENTQLFDIKMQVAFADLMNERKWKPLELALIEHYAGVSKIWTRLNENSLDKYAIQKYYNIILQTKKYKNDALTVQVSTNVTFGDQGAKIGTELGAGYAWSADKFLIKAAFGVRFIKADGMQYVVNGRDVEVKDERYLFANLGVGYQIKKLSFADIYLTADLSFRTQNFLYVTYYTAANEPVYRESMQGNGYFAPGLALKKNLKGSYLLLETKYFSSLNKGLAESRSADQMVISVMYAFRFREGTNKSHFK